MKKAVLIIICYFISIFISNFGVARELKVRWVDGLIPGGNNAHGSLTCQASRVATALNKDRTEHPTDVVWSDDGLIVYTVNEDDRGDMNGRQLSMNKVAIPFLVTSDLMTSKGEDVTIEKIEEEEIMLQAEEVFEEGADVDLSDETESEDITEVEAAPETEDDPEAESAEEIAPEKAEDSTE